MTFSLFLRVFDGILSIYGTVEITKIQNYKYIDKLVPIKYFVVNNLLKISLALIVKIRL